MADTCNCEAAPVLIFPCSGGSNVGQIANQAAVELTKEGVGKLFCLAGIGGHIDSFIESSKGNRIVAIDGCPVACAKKIYQLMKTKKGSREASLLKQKIKITDI